MKTPPVLTLDQPVDVPTLAGFFRSSSSPTPSCPKSLSPQQYNAPLEWRAQACEEPASMLSQLVEVPMIETVLNVTAAQTMEYEVFGRIMERRGNRGHTAAVQDIYRCAGDDSWVAVCAHTEAQRAALAELAGGTDAKLEQWLASQDAEVATETLVRNGIPAAIVVSPSLVVDNPQLRHRGFFEKLEHPRTGAGLYPCPPFARPDGVDAWLYRTPPTLGEHNAEVLMDLCGLEQSDLDRLGAHGVIGTRPKGL